MCKLTWMHPVSRTQIKLNLCGAEIKAKQKEKVIRDRYHVIWHT